MLPTELTYSKVQVIAFLERHHAIFFDSIDDRDVWIMPDQTIIQFPSGNDRISYDRFEEIAIEQMGVSTWDFDSEI